MERSKVSGSHPAMLPCSPGSSDPQLNLNRARGHLQIPHHWPSGHVLADVTGCDASPAHACKLQTWTDMVLGRTIIYSLRPRSPPPAIVSLQGAPNYLPTLRLAFAH